MKMFLSELFLNRKRPSLKERIATAVSTVEQHHAAKNDDLAPMLESLENQLAEQKSILDRIGAVESQRVNLEKRLTDVITAQKTRNAELLAKQHSLETYIKALESLNDVQSSMARSQNSLWAFNPTTPIITVNSQSASFVEQFKKQLLTRMGLPCTHEPDVLYRLTDSLEAANSRAAQYLAEMTKGPNPDKP